MSSNQQPTFLGQLTQPPFTRVAVSVGDDPLAAGVVTQIHNTSSVLPTSKQQLNFCHNQNAMVSIPAPVGAVATAIKSPISSVAAQIFTPVPMLHSVPSSSKSLDALADEFLSSKRGPNILRPNPLPRGEPGILRLRTLVERRAWGDVLKLASTLLSNNGNNSTSTSIKSSSSRSRQYSIVYASLLIKKHGFENEQHLSTNNDYGCDVPPNIRKETIEIMVLRCNAWLKLRRYADLSKEVERWNFLTQNDATVSSPEWVPFNIRKFDLQ